MFSSNRMRTIAPPRNQGQSMVEYLLVLVVLLSVLFLGNPSPLQQVLQAIRVAYQKFAYALSLPL